MGTQERVNRLKDRLAKIAIQDTGLVIETNRAMRKMADLGLGQEQVRALLTNNPPTPGQIMPDPATEPFQGFDSRRQASLAAWGAMAKKDRPGALGDVHDRVNSLIKNQEAPRAAGTIGLAIIAIPAMATVDALPSEVKRFRRMKSGKLREISPVEEAGAIDVEEEVVESTIMVRPHKTSDE